jgi:hypothetical protein
MENEAVGRGNLDESGDIIGEVGWNSANDSEESEAFANSEP